MDPPSDLARWLDFDRGLKFQEEARRRFKSPVHHPFPSPNGSFFLLVTFRRFLFRLTEESVSFALQSCLGGRAADFHVQFLSNNHFRCSVFSKEIGFSIYKLRRITTSSFDIYFHLWNNGTPHWEKEKRDWEVEQEKEWTKVLSKSAKREKKKKGKLKQVRFADPPVQPPIAPAKNSMISISFGPFASTVDPNNPLKKTVFSSPQRESCDPMIKAKSVTGSSHLSISISNSSTKPLGQSIVCYRCLGLGHTKRFCLSDIRCARCLELGHIQRFCRSLHPAKKMLQWRPKATTSLSQPAIEWRPKIPIPRKEENSAKFDSLDSCATMDPSTAIVEDQEQIVNQFATVLLQDEGLAIEEVMLQSDGSSSSSDAICEAANEERARYNAVGSHCATVTLFHRKEIPSGSVPSTIRIKPIFIDNTLLGNNLTVEENKAKLKIVIDQCPEAVIFHRKGIPSNSSASAHFIIEPASVENIAPAINNEQPDLSIVLWVPVTDATALKLWPSFDIAIREAKRIKQKKMEELLAAMLIIDQAGIVHEEPKAALVTNESAPPDDSVITELTSHATADGEFETDETRMMSRLDKGKSPLEPIPLPSDMLQPDQMVPEKTMSVVAIENLRNPPIIDDHMMEAQQQAQQKDTKSKNKRKGMALPSLVSASDPRTPLVQSSVRRSTRLATGLAGFRQVRLVKEPSKRAKNWLMEIDENTGELHPISLSTLKEWGIACGVDPMDLTDESLLQVPTHPAPDVENDEDN